jgi:hypothetical protein
MQCRGDFFGEGSVEAAGSAVAAGSAWACFERLCVPPALFNSFLLLESGEVVPSQLPKTKKKNPGATSVTKVSEDESEERDFVER